DIYLAKVDLNASGPIPQQPINQTDPVSLSVALSNFAYPGGGESLLAGTFATRNGTHVVIVNQNNIPDALAASVLARANLATVLLSPSTGLPATVKAEITRLAPAGAYVIGNDLSSQVITDLTSLGIDPTQITGISGADDPTTAAMIASQMDMRSASEKAAGTPAFDAAVIVDPASPDAVAASALAAARRLPILFVDQNSIPAATSAALSSLNITTTLVIGGPQWISDTVLGALPGAKRLGGADQFATSKAAVAESMARGLPDNIVYVADGSRPMDAALLGAAVGRTTGVMLLSPGPVDITAAGTVSSAGLTGVDRIVTVEPPPATPTPTPTPQPIVTPTSLTLSAASLTHKVFRVGSPATAVTAKKSKKKRAPIGTTLKFTLSSAAKVKIVISELTTGRRSGKKCVKATHALRHHARCTLAVTKGTLVRTHAITGANAVPFSGRIGKGALQPGRYEATLSATDSSGRDSNVVHLSFKIVRQRE
ncbi:MAG: cell wall-binding repeat-containing protein, partial [Actinomycetota bacterium]|nr:cell wall-binding repeat-containing protein [Actinomycetota bacterium]